jgi:hypothetical protein
LEDEGLQDLLEQWQFYYTWQPYHGSVWKTPMDRCCALLDKAPLSKVVALFFDEVREQGLYRRQELGRILKKVK